MGCNERWQDEPLAAPKQTSARHAEGRLTGL
jgi:hypothetical protein